MSKITRCILLINFYVILSQKNVVANNKLIEMIKDVVVSFQQPASVSIFFCNKIDSINLIKLLSNNGVSASVHRPTIEPVPYPFPPNIAFFVIDLFCDKSFDLLNKADKLKLFSSPYKWLMVSSYEEDPERLKLKMLETFSTIQVLLDSQVMISHSVSNDSYLVSKLFKRGPDRPLILYDYATWTPHTRIIQNTTMDKYRKDLNGIVLKSCIVITNNDTINHLTDKRHKQIDTITKVNYVLVSHVGDFVNGTLQYSIRNTWGYANNQSEWSGMIGELQREEADIGGTALFLTKERIPVIDYITMPSPTKSKFVFRKPKLSYVSNIYVLPFHWSVWLSTLILIVVTALALYTTVKWEYKKNMVPQEQVSASSLHDSGMDVALLAFGAMCQQATSSIPNSVSGRIVTIILFLSLMFLYTSYSANIVSLLQSSSNTIRTLKDLLNSRLDVGVDDTVFNHFYFPNASEPVRRAIYLRKVAPPGQTPRFYEISEGVKKMREGHFAFHMEAGVGYKIVQETFEEHEKCELQEIQFLQVTDPWLALQKNSSYKEILKIGFRKIQESGLQAREVSLMYTKKPTCVNRGSSFVSVTLIDCYLAACVLLCGIIFAFILLLIEVGVSHRQRKVLSHIEKLRINDRF